MKKHFLKIAAALFIVIAVITVIHWDWVKAYTNNFLFNHFEHGDKVYVSSKIFKNDKITAVVLYRFVRPLNDTEIQAGHPSEVTLKLIKRNIELLPKSYAVMCGKMFTKETLNKQKSALIGIYISNELCEVWYDYSKTIHTFNGFLIQPTAYILDLSYDKNNAKVPEGFTWANNNLYVYQGDVTSSELSTFKQ